MRGVVLAGMGMLMGCAAGQSPPLAPAPASASASAPASAPAPPGCDDAAYRQMDFWLGDWDTAIRARSSPEVSEWKEARGTNHVRAPLGKCVVEESFHGDGPGQPWAGISVSTYVPQAGAWRQTWVDDSGAYLAFRGGLEGPAFVLYGEPRGDVLMRMVFKDITQDAFLWSWERGTVGGTTWKAVMEIRYTRQQAK